MKALLAILILSSLAQAKTMSCLVGVYRASDMTATDESQVAKTFKQLDMTLDKTKSFEGEFTINDETVAVSLWKRQFADVYDVNFVLTTPVADRYSGSSYVASISDFLVNIGPAKDNGWTIDPKPGALEFEYIQSRSGKLLLTQKLKKALQDNNKWGKHPFNTVELDVQNSYAVAQVVIELLALNALKTTDVIAMSTLLTCTLNK